LQRTPVVIVLIDSWVHFILFFEKVRFIGPSSIFFGTLGTPAWKHLFGPPVAK
jgi:hypothetical protein